MAFDFGCFAQELPAPNKRLLRALPPGILRPAGMVGRFPETLITGAVGSDLHPITWDLDGKQYGGFGDGTGFGGNGGTLVSYGFYSIENGPVGATYTDLLMGPSGTGHGKPDSLLGVNSVMYVILNGQDGTHALRKTT